MLLINIVTPLTRPNNIASILLSMTQFSKLAEVCWYIVADTDSVNLKTFAVKDDIVDVDADFSCYLYHYPSLDRGISGNPQRNFALDMIKDGYVYFLDDDNIIHPHFARKVIPLLEQGYEGVSVRQIYKNGTSRLLTGPASMKVCHTDTAQHIISRELIGDTRWAPFDYCADGHFIEEVFNKNPNGFHFINEGLCYYNYLRD